MKIGRAYMVVGAGLLLAGCSQLGFFSRPAQIRAPAVKVAVKPVPKPRPAIVAAVVTDVVDTVAVATVVETPAPEPIVVNPATTNTAKSNAATDLARITPPVIVTDACMADLTARIPERAQNAMSGSVLVKQTMDLSGPERDNVVSGQILAGNVPSFLRNLIPVNFSGRAHGQTVRITICVTPDYLSVGDDADFVRVPLGLPAAAKVADHFDFLLPTTKMVDAIYAQAQVHLIPRPMQASAQMSSTNYFWQHNQTIEAQRSEAGDASGLLTAGQKKDLVLSNVLRRAPGRVAIYGWQRENGKPIQPLSTVHGERYADYSHGIRLVSETAFVDGAVEKLSDILQNPDLASIVSNEGPIARSQILLAAVSKH